MAIHRWTRQRGTERPILTEGSCVGRDSRERADTSHQRRRSEMNPDRIAFGEHHRVRDANPVAPGDAGSGGDGTSGDSAAIERRERQGSVVLADHSLHHADAPLRGRPATWTLGESRPTTLGRNE